MRENRDPLPLVDPKEFEIVQKVYWNPQIKTLGEYKIDDTVVFLYNDECPGAWRAKIVGFDDRGRIWASTPHELKPYADKLKGFATYSYDPKNVRMATPEEEIDMKNFKPYEIEKVPARKEKIKKYETKIIDKTSKIKLKAPNFDVSEMAQAALAS